MKSTELSRDRSPEFRLDLRDAEEQGLHYTENGERNFFLAGHHTTQLSDQSCTARPAEEIRKCN